jgi:urocanate hydratase
MLMNNGMGMGGAQPLAVTMNDGVAPVVEVDRAIWARWVYSGEWPILNVLVSTAAGATWVGVDPMSVAGHAG